MGLNKIALLGLTMSLLLFVGCRQLNGSSALSTPEYTRTLSVTPTVTLVPTLTPIPTYTPVPPSITPIIIPTLPVEEANERLLDLLANNGGCRLPCLWGITPGTSTYQNAQAILEPLSSLSDFTDLFPSPGDISPVYTKGNFVLYTRIAFLYPESGIISHIHFTAEPREKITDGYKYDFNSQFFRDHVSNYMLPQILTIQGMPSSVEISALAGPPTRGGQEGFFMILLYPEQGVLVHYSTQWRRAGNNILGCLSNSRIQLELYPSGHGDSFFDLLKQTDWAVKLNNFKPLEEVTSMSLEEFYRTFRQPTDRCIETPAKLWPTPEP